MYSFQFHARPVQSFSIIIMSLPPETAIYIPSHPAPGEIALPALPPLVPSGTTAAAADGEVAVDYEGVPVDGEASPKRRSRISVLTNHEALSLFSQKGIYVDESTGELRTSANHKPCGKWDVHRYNRHFGMKVWKKYEGNLLHTEEEQRRLLDAKERYFRMNPIVEESSLFRKRRRMKGGEKMLTVDELRVHEKHWIQMWKSARNELKQLRSDLKVEMDEEVRVELMADVEGLKKRKADWAKLLGLDAPPDAAIF